MTTAIDTNVLVALWDEDTRMNTTARQALDSAQAQGSLVVAGAVYAELLALPGRTEMMLDTFFARTRIRIDWEPGEGVWRAAGRAFQGHVGRRRATKPESPRRILADFIIGAHASFHRYRLLTLDHRHYRAAFPKLEVITL